MSDDFVDTTVYSSSCTFLRSSIRFLCITYRATIVKHSLRNAWKDSHAACRQLAVSAKSSYPCVLCDLLQNSLFSDGHSAGAVNLFVSICYLGLLLKWSI